VLNEEARIKRNCFKKTKSNLVKGTQPLNHNLKQLILLFRFKPKFDFSVQLILIKDQIDKNFFVNI